MKIDKLVDAIGYINEETIKDAKETSGKTIHFPIKKLAALAAALLVCIGSVPALVAADIAPAYDMLYSISPALAQKLKPVNKSCVDKGIQMEVGSAYIHGDTAEVMICFKDLESNRIDESIDLFDSYDIRNSSDSMGTCSLVSYDKETGVATFSVLLTQMRGKSFTGDKVTVSVSRLLCNKKTFKGIFTEIDLSAVNKTPAILDKVNIRGGSFSDLPEGTAFLKPEASPLSAPINGASVTALGYENGNLHVQMCYEDILNTDNHGWIWLQDQSGNLLECNYSECFWDSTQTDSYQEYVFEIPYEELENYQIYGDLTIGGMLINGDWQITFPMSEVR